MGMEIINVVGAACFCGGRCSLADSTLTLVLLRRGLHRILSGALASYFDAQ